MKLDRPTSHICQKKADVGHHRTNSEALTGALGKTIQQFLRSLQQRNAAANTILAYTKDLTSFCEFIGVVKPAKIDHVRIRGYLSELYDRGLGKTSIARSLAASSSRR